MNFLKRKASKPSTTHSCKKSNVITSDNNSNGNDSDSDKGTQGPATNQPPEPSHNDDEIVDTTEAENAKKQESVKKTSQYRHMYSSIEYLPFGIKQK